LSVDAAHDALNDVVVMLDAARPVGAHDDHGADRNVPGHDGAVIVVRADTLPAASKACTPSV